MAAASHKKQLERIAKRVLEGTASEEEILFLKEYYDAFDSAAGSEDQLTHAERNDLNREIKEEVFRRIHSGQTPVIPMYRRRFFRVAVAVVILCVASFIFRNEVYNLINPVETLQLAAGKGELKQVTLPDGSRVWLSPESMLHYPGEFRGKTREITLTGEAFFEAAPAPDHPFIVHSGDVATRVLGTSFTITAYKEQPSVEVTVLTGKVAVSAETGKSVPELSLLPDQRAVFNKSSQSLQKEKAPDAANMRARREGRLIYDGATVATVVADLNRFYSIPVKLKEGVGNCSYYGELDTHENLEALLREICLILHMQLSKKDDHYIISGEGC